MIPFRFLLPLLAGLLLTLTGCGFHLRGDLSLPPDLSPLAIEGLGKHDALRKELTRQLQAAGIAVQEDAPNHLRIQSVQSERRVLSVDAGAKVAEYELYEGVEFRVTGPGGAERVAAQKVGVMRDYVNTDTRILGRQADENDLRNDMRRDLSTRILERLRAAP